MGKPFRRTEGVCTKCGKGDSRNLSLKEIKNKDGTVTKQLICEPCWFFC